MEQISIQWEPERRIFRVGELNAAIRTTLEQDFSNVWVAGEISGCRPAASGHCYFTLKDRDSQIRCVCFRGTLRFLRFKPQDGLQVLARGRIDVYEARGEYQLLVEALEPQGHGALQLAFEQLKKKLAAEGLFEASRKRPLPALPLRIGIVTSPTGAAIRDMIQVLTRRFPGLHIRLYPAQVQGDGSVAAVCEGIEYFSLSQWADVVIVGRGGGSLEDLWTFNEESVARAIAACRVPVISAVGHETDFTIADFVADLRAPTPSAAAELVICTRQQLLDRIAAARQELAKAVRFRLVREGSRVHQLGTDRAGSLLHRKIGRAMQRVDECDYRLRDRTRAGLQSRRRRLQELEQRLGQRDLRLQLANARRRLEAAQTIAPQQILTHLARARGRLEPLLAHLTQLSPEKILERGYAIVQDETGGVIKEARQTSVGSAVTVRLARGRLRADVTETIVPPGSSELPS